MAPTYRPYCDEQQQQRKVTSKPGGSGRWLAVLGLGGDPAEMKRRRRVAGYKAYAVEGKLKASIRRGLRWIKAKYCDRIATIPIPNHNHNHNHS